MALDGNFPTVKKPNPELPEAFALGIRLADAVQSDMIVATDPDSDRMGAMTRAADGAFVAITGNQMAALLLDYIFTALREGGGIPVDGYAVKTIVSTELATAICRANGVKLYNVLTGFKFIGEVIKNHEACGEGTFLFGFEESYGYLKGTYARDKDAVCAAMLAVEMAAYYKAKNMTLYDALQSIYARYGYYGEKSLDVYMEGLDGIARRTATMQALRNDPPRKSAAAPWPTLAIMKRKRLFILPTAAGSRRDCPNQTCCITGWKTGMSLWFVRPVRSRKSRFIILPARRMRMR